MKKILLIAGHGAGDPGACSSYGTEATETRRVVNQLKAILDGYDVSVDVYNTNRNAYADCGNGTIQVDFAKYDYVFEVHFNSASNVSATGVEIWVTPQESGVSVEEAIVKNVSALGFPNRGIKREDFRVIRTAKNKGTSSALLEVCFISNQGDMNRYNTGFNNVCQAIATGITTGFGINKKANYVPPVQQPTTPTPSTPKINYYVKTSSGKQLGAYNILENAKNMAQKNNAIVFDYNNKVVVSYVQTKQYVNLKPHKVGWNVYPLNVAPIIKNACGRLAPKTYGGLSYEILGNPQTDVYTIQTSSFGKVNIYAPKDNDSSITNYPMY